MSKLLKLGALVAAGGAISGCAQKEEQTRPNVVFILADDLGWGDLGCYGQKLVETPNIDALASRGMLFTQNYSGTTVSAPSRSCLLTGTHSGHTYIRGNLRVPPEGQFPLPEGMPNIFQDFKAAGYTTGAFGKWGLGPIGSTGDPNAQGVDKFVGFNCQTLAHSYYPDHIWDNNQKIVFEDNVDEIPYGEGTYAPDIIHDASLEFMETAVENGQPFFMWYPTILPHAELIVPQDSLLTKYLGKFPETPYDGVDLGEPRFRVGGYCSQEAPHATFAAMVSRLDMYVGEIVAKLKELGVYDNTIVIFSSDNGPHVEGGADPDFFDGNGPWKGYKRDLYEGGIRVPLIVEWPGVVEAGSTSDHMCAFWDMMPTFREIIGAESAENPDGVSILPTLKGEKGQKEHEYLYFEFAERSRQALRKGDWKLIRMDIGAPTDRYELYNILGDPGEDNDVAAQNPEIVEELKALMVEAHIPNSNFPLFAGE